MEQFVVERIKSIGSDPGLKQEVMEILSRHHEEEREALVAEELLLDREIKRWGNEANNLVGQIKADEVSTLVTSRLAQVQERIAHEKPRLAHVRQRTRPTRRVGYSCRNGSQGVATVRPTMAGDDYGRTTKAPATAHRAYRV